MKSLFLLMVLLLFCGSSLSSAQDFSKLKLPVVVEGDAGACESNIAYLWNLISEAEKTGERLIVIARLGKSETSRYLTHRRLFNAREYIITHLKSGNTIFAEGEQSTGEGQVEFYLGSKLMLVFLVKRGGDLCVCCC